MQDAERVNDVVVAVCRDNGQSSYGYAFFHFRGILPVGSISRGKKQFQNRKKEKKNEVGNVDIGWAVGHTWFACTNVSLMTGNYDQRHRNTK